MPTLAINFSRPASQVVAQYYNLIRLGKSGYRAIHQACQDVAVHLARQIAGIGPFELMSQGTDLPVFAWRLKEDAASGRSTIWPTACATAAGRCPAYRMPANRQDLVVQRVVVRNGFTCDLAGHAGARHPPPPGLVRRPARLPVHRAGRAFHH